MSSSVAGFLAQYEQDTKEACFGQHPHPSLRCPRGCGDSSPPQSPPSFPRRASPREDGGGNPSPVAASLVDAHSIPSSNYLTLAIPIPPVIPADAGIHPRRGAPRGRPSHLSIELPDTYNSDPPRYSRGWRPLHNRHSGFRRNPESHDLAMSRVVLHRHLNAIR